MFVLHLVIGFYEIDGNLCSDFTLKKFRPSFYGKRMSCGSQTLTVFDGSVLGKGLIGSLASFPLKCLKFNFCPRSNV